MLPTPPRGRQRRRFTAFPFRPAPCHLASTSRSGRSFARRCRPVVRSNSRTAPSRHSSSTTGSASDCEREGRRPGQHPPLRCDPLQPRRPLALRAVHTVVCLRPVHLGRIPGREGGETEFTYGLRLADQKGRSLRDDLHRRYGPRSAQLGHPLGWGIIPII